MKKNIIRIILFLGILLSIHVILWGGMLYQFANFLNTHKTEFTYNKNIITFQNAKIILYPHQVGLKFLASREKALNSTINYQDPIVLKYSFFTRALTLQYNGTAQILLHPIEAGFSNRIVGNFQYLIKIPYINMFKMVYKLIKEPDQLDWNFFFKYCLPNASASYKAQNLKLFDGIDHSLLYAQDIFSLNCSFPKNKARSLEEFKQSVHQDIRVQAILKVSAAAKAKRIIIPQSSIFNFTAGIEPVEAKLDLVFQTSADELAQKAFLQDSSLKADLELNFKGYQVTNHTDLKVIKEKMWLAINSALDLSKASVKPSDKEIFQLLGKKFADNFKNYPPSIDSKLISAFKSLDCDIKGELTGLKEEDNQTEGNFSQFKIGINMTESPEELNINPLTPTQKLIFNIINSSVLVTDKDFKIQGEIFCEGLNHLINLSGQYLSPLMLGSTTNESIEFTKDFLQYFLKSVSNHPDSTNKDYIFSYHCEGANKMIPEHISLKINERPITDILRSYHKSLQVQINDYILQKYGKEDLEKKFFQLAPKIFNQTRSLDIKVTKNPNTSEL